MFAICIRNTALALAGAAIIASTLTTTIAAAERVPLSLPHPGGAETVAALELDRPTADIVVEKVSESGDVHTQKLLMFRVTSLGPEKVTVTITKITKVIRGDGNPGGDRIVYTRTFAPGEIQDVPVYCIAPTNGRCTGGDLSTTFRGIDPDPHNNYAGYIFPYSY